MDSKKQRTYSVVIHNVHPQDAKYWSDFCNKLDTTKCIHSIEEYPESPGHHHIHIFIEFKNARHFKPTLKLFQSYEKTKVYPTPIQGMVPGRVQVDSMKGTFEQATAYLTKGLSKKDKNFGEVIHNERTKCTRCKKEIQCTVVDIPYPLEAKMCIPCFDVCRPLVTDFFQSLAAHREAREAPQEYFLRREYHNASQEVCPQED